MSFGSKFNGVYPSKYNGVYGILGITRDTLQRTQDRCTTYINRVAPLIITDPWLGANQIIHIIGSDPVEVLLPAIPTSLYGSRVYILNHDGAIINFNGNRQNSVHFTSLASTSARYIELVNVTTDDTSSFKNYSVLTSI